MPNFLDVEDLEPPRRSVVSRTSIARRPALATYRSENHTELLREVHRYFVALREGMTSGAAYVAAWGVVPDLKSMELAPGLSPEVRQRRHNLVRFFSDHAIRLGISGSAALSTIEVAVCVEIDDAVFGRGVQTLFPESAEVSFDQ